MSWWDPTGMLACQLFKHGYDTVHCKIATNSNSREFKLACFFVKIKNNKKLYGFPSDETLACHAWSILLGLVYVNIILYNIMPFIFNSYFVQLTPIVRTAYASMLKPFEKERNDPPLTRPFLCLPGANPWILSCLSVNPNPCGRTTKWPNLLAKSNPRVSLA